MRFALGGALLAACAVPQPDRDGWDRGIDPLTAAEIGRGDRALFSVELDERGERERWFVFLRVTNPEHREHRRRNGNTHHTMAVDVLVLDAEGETVGGDEVLLSREDLQRGFALACRGEGSPGTGVFPPRGPEDHSETMRATLALLNVFRTARMCRVLDELLWRALGLRGVDVRQEAFFTKARRGQPFDMDGQTFLTEELPFELVAADQPALRGMIVATDPRSPLGICAGVLAILAWRPGEPETTCTLRLLAARRGGES